MYYILLCLIGYIFLVSLITKKSRKFSEVLGIIILTFITFMIGLRYNVGLDYFNYEDAFNIRYNLFSYEPIYSLIMYVFKIAFDKFYYVTFIMILTANTYIYLGLKKRDIKGIYIILSIFIYSSNIALVFMNLMRQSVAVAMFFYASTYIEERNFKRYSLFILLGAGFHSSMLLLLPVYFIKKIKFSRISYLISIITCYFLVYTKFTQTIINFIAYRLPMYQKYYNHKYIFNEEINLLSLGVLLNVVLIYALVLISKKQMKYDKDVNYYLIGVLVNIMSLSSFMFDRIGIYFFIFGIAAIPKMVENIKNKNTKYIFFVLAILVAASFYTQALIINPKVMNLEYKSIFDLK